MAEKKKAGGLRSTRQTKPLEYSDYTLGELDGIDRCIGLVEEKLSIRESGLAMLLLRCGPEMGATPAELRLLLRVRDRDVQVQQLKGLLKSFKHFKRQAAKCF